MMDHSLQWTENYYVNTNLFLHMQGIEGWGGVFISLVPYLGEPWFQISIRTPVILARGGFPYSIEASAGCNSSKQITTASFHAFAKHNLLTTLRFHTERMKTP